MDINLAATPLTREELNTKLNFMWARVALLWAVPLPLVFFGLPLLNEAFHVVVVSVALLCLMSAALATSYYVVREPFNPIPGSWYAQVSSMMPSSPVIKDYVNAVREQKRDLTYIEYWKLREQSELVGHHIARNRFFRA